MRAALFALALTVALVHCKNDAHEPAPGAITDAAPSASFALPSKPSATTPATSASAPTGPLPCRAIAIDGAVIDADGGAPLSVSGKIGDGVYQLAAGARVTVKAPESGREITFEGPALVRACVGGDPEHWLLQGTAVAVPGTGEKPGAEDWIITPFGIVSYTSVRMKVSVEKDRATVRVSSGTATIFAPKPAPGPDAGPATLTQNGWSNVTSIAPADMLDPGNTKAIVDACASAAKEARELAVQIAAPGANLGELAPKHVQARRKAHAECAIARAAARSDKTLAPRAEAADAEWRVVVH